MQLTGARVEPAKWETAIAFRAATIAWHGGALWAAGPDGGGDIDDYDWERLGGGGFAALDPTNGGIVMSGPLPDDIAWGTGGVAVARFGPWLATASRRGCLYLVDPRSGASHRAGGHSPAPPLALPTWPSPAAAPCAGSTGAGTGFTPLLSPPPRSKARRA